jgi:hypothetical protein
MNRFNNWLAQKITAMVGSMWCAYLFIIISLISLPAVLATKNIDVFITWLTQTFLQLVLISVIIAGQEIQNKKEEKRLEDTLAHITSENNRIIKELSQLIKIDGRIETEIEQEMKK